MAEKVNRWKFVYAALVMQLCLGVLYSWSVFRPVLEKANGWKGTVSIAPFRYSLLFFTIAMIVAGFWQDKKGPKLVGTVGGVLLGVGCFLSAVMYQNPMGLNFAYGILGGLGVGFAYVTPIATCVKWFPDKRGTIVGLAVLGFGAGSLIFAPVIQSLLGSDPALFATTIPRTFGILGVVFLICVIGAARVFDVPPAGYKPEGWNPPAAATSAAGVVQKAEFAPGEMIKTWQFYALWLIYFLGTSCGITAIGQAAPLVKELAAATAIMSAGAALGIMSAFNGVGRLAWGATSDKIGRKMTTIAMFISYIIACVFLLRNVTSFVQALAGLCVVGFAYGGYLAMMPAFTADFYGPKNVGANYGIVFTAWGICGFVVPGYFAKIIQAAKDAGNVAAGYNETYFTLAGMSVVGIILVLLLKKPVQDA
ncbi:MAG: OFA family MFS transporter [Deltaproteobacteria bacterium]|nr:OFA family MFS transporter [Deltaproteobacteria bacterium]